MTSLHPKHYDAQHLKIHLTQIIDHQVILLNISIIDVTFSNKNDSKGYL
jgi:hypothetical protein